MDIHLTEIETARAYWWQVYCKCQHISITLENDPKGTVRLTDMHKLRGPCRSAQQATRELLWNYLKRQSDAESISLEIEEPVAGVKITSVWLWAYFGYQFLNSLTLDTYQSMPKQQPFTPNEQLEFYRRISVFFLTLLKKVQADIHEDQDSLRLEDLEGISYSQFARSLMFLVSEYSHLDVGIPRALDVEKCLQDAMSADAFLYSTREQYRDHIFHVVDVCLLGLFLLRCRFPDGQAVWELLISDPSGLPETHEATMIQNWFIAALFHDVGYSLEAEERSKNDFLRQSGADPQQDEWQVYWEIEKLRTRLDTHKRTLELLELQRARFGESYVPISIILDIEEKQREIHQLEIRLNDLMAHRVGFFVKQWPAPRASATAQTPPGIGMDNQQPASVLGTERRSGKDHGERSADYVEQILKALSGDDGELINLFRPALKAMQKHNLMQEPIDCSSEPLSFLLVLCDELQEWGRARADLEEIREAIVIKMIFPDSSMLSTNRLLEYLFVGVTLDEDHKYGLLPGHTLDFCLQYKDATLERFEPLAVWLLKSYNMQRLRLDDRLTVRVAMRNPVCQDLYKLSHDATEFHLLRDFMRDRRKWRELQAWIENNDVVKWETSKGVKSDSRVENIILHLNGFNGVQVLLDDPRKLLDELVQWRRDYINGKRRRF